MLRHCGYAKPSLPAISSAVVSKANGRRNILNRIALGSELVWKGALQYIDLHWSPEWQGLPADV